MKHLIQTLRIGMALFLAIFGTSAIPTATAFALEDPEVVSEEQAAETPPAVEIQSTPVIVEETPPPPPVEPEAPALEQEEATVVTEKQAAPAALLTEEAPAEEARTFVTQNNVQPTPLGDVVDVPKKVTICHRTASYTNPYVSITVDVSAADGISGNSGNEADHYGEHQGPLFNSSLPKHTEWGDIIPVIVGIHLGQNLANGGQAILDAGCTTPIELEVVASTCVIGDAANGTLTIWLYGAAGGTKVNVSDGTSFNINDNTAMPLVITGLGSGEYTVTVEKGKDVLKSVKVTIETCPAIEIPLPSPTTMDPCGRDNATWVLPANTEQYTWELTENNELIVTAVPPYVFPGEKLSHNFGIPTDENEPCPIEATVVEPGLKDKCYTDQDGIYIQYVKGVVYKVNGETTTGWVSFTGTTLNVTAEAKEGYVLAEGSTTSWTYDMSDFTDEQCLTITKSAKVASDTNLDGKIGVGDTVTWEITVTNISDQDCENFYVTVEDPNTELENNGYIGFLGSGESETLMATSTITENDLAVCKVTNVATFLGWRAYRVFDTESRSILNNQEEETFPPLTTDSASATYNLYCPPVVDGGQILGDTTVKTVAVTATPQVLPATLPATGASDSSNIYLILGMAMSALTYFAMMRRYQEA